MTVIAFDGRTLATDGQDTTDDIKRGCGAKFVQIKQGPFSGAYAANCGEWGRGNDIKRWLEGGDLDENRDAFRAKYNETLASSLLLVTPTGKAWIINDYDLELQATDIPVALGSGAPFAYGALDGGLGAVAAVEVACKRDPHCGFGVYSVDVKGD